MQIQLKQRVAEPIDEATKAALEVGLAQLRRGEGVPLEQVREKIKSRAEAWRKNQEPALTE